jgi:hypothetical protein
MEFIETIVNFIVRGSKHSSSSSTSSSATNSNSMGANSSTQEQTILRNAALDMLVLYLSVRPLTFLSLHLPYHLLTIFLVF